MTVLGDIVSVSEMQPVSSKVAGGVQARRREGTTIKEMGKKSSIFANQNCLSARGMLGTG